ncbi:MAG: type I DNA topoisomerase [Propionibacteriaceae bacterium]|jgi:DNA topoisomerase-1|nr:type I DNA topoisomerase [Propionibacteriaceae bacterium]
MVSSDPSAKRRLVIVESPTKAAKIASYLGPGYIVESSRGHVRDLPQGAADVPAKYKQEKWARTGVDVDHDFEPLYVVSADKRSTIRALKEKLKGADELLLATDGDREGEAIAWHLLQELKPKVPAKRMVFHEITPQAISEAVAHPRDLDADLVDAQETRRILDRLYGYEVSPVLWKKVMPKLSAGRVQSVATRLVVDRERDRMRFQVASYWDLTASLDAGPEAAPPLFNARLSAVGGRKVAQGRDFDESGQLRGDPLRLDQAGATELAARLRQSDLAVAQVEARPYTRRPYAPFRTTTLQQEAGRKLGFTAQRTMSVAQDLYEGGWITYMRTDSVTLSDQAIQAARAQVLQLYGPKYLPAKPRLYSSKVKNAQEAHEAIRPAGEVFPTPAQSGLAGDQRRLYELIWTRTVASQMTDAEGRSVSIQIDAAWSGPVELDGRPVEECRLTASGRTISFPGFLKAYVESHDDPDQADDDAQARLPELTVGQAVTVAEVAAEGHETRPPARYTEPSLVAKLEELEIGRPSTYASIIRTITARDYVFKRGAALVPTWLAFAVTRLLEEQFPKLIDYDFTATMETDLDDIAQGDAKRLEVLRGFYFGSPKTGQGLRELVGGLGEIDARRLSSFPLPGDDGLVVRVGKYGTYVEDAQGRRANLPDDLPPDELTSQLALGLLERGQSAERVLGVAPDNGYTVVVKDGRYGPYVAELLPEGTPKSVKARTGSLFSAMSPDTVTLADALKLMSLPRVVGQAGDGQTVTAQNGRFGPYLKKGTESRPLPSQEAIFEVSLAEAEAAFAQPRGRGAAAAPLRELGPDPVSGQPVVVKSGRFGPYVTDGAINATLRKDDSAESISLERAAELLAEKRAKPPTTRRTPARRTTRAKK